MRPPVRRALPYCTLGFTKPRPYRKSELSEAIPPHIHPQLLLESESKTWNPMVKHSCCYPKFFFIKEPSGRSAQRWDFVPAEGFVGTEFAHSTEPIAAKLRNEDDEIDRIFIQKI